MSPYVYVLTAAVLAAIDPALEEAAETSGSRTGDAAIGVLPLAIPGIGAAALVAFSTRSSNSAYLILGRPANVPCRPRSTV
jgi:ABC-type Fe3+ transport system permease subunit